jgi:hypothetical protein
MKPPRTAGAHLIGYTLGRLASMFSDAMRMLGIFRRRAQSPLDKACSLCGAPAHFGYSQHAEERLEKLEPRCLDCLKEQLRFDYRTFNGKAVVVQPAPGPPVYVFQPALDWGRHFTESRIADDVVSLLEDISDGCADCGSPVKYLWVESRGLTERNFEEVLDRGISRTLLRDNPAPVSLCAECCVQKISAELEARDIAYLEICSPKDDTTGFVLPMGY